MRLKLDENLSWRFAERLRRAGHEVATVRDEGLGGTDDDALFVRCRQAGRCLVTLDLDFGNVLRFPPEKTAGLVVLRPAGRPSLTALEDLIRQLVEALSRACGSSNPGESGSTSRRKRSECRYPSRTRVAGPRSG